MLRYILEDEWMTLKGTSIIHKYESKMILHIPAKMHRDSAFPFKDGDSIRLMVEDGKLIIAKMRKA